MFERIMSDELLKASGYVYHNASRTRESFREMFGFDALKYPKYFYLTRTNLVAARSNFNKDCEVAFSQSRAMTAMLCDRGVI